MNVILFVITEIQQSLNELEDLQDASEDVAKLKGKIAQNNQKQNELLKKINALKETLQKSPNIRNLQEQLQNLKTNLTNNILDHKRLQRRPPGNSPNQTGNSPNQTRLEATVAPTPKQRKHKPHLPDPRGKMLGGYRYSGNSPGKIINIKSRTKSKKKKNRTKRRM
jgi:seryl-tRNA synthetase